MTAPKVVGVVGGGRKPPRMLRVKVTHGGPGHKTGQGFFSREAP